MRNAYKRTKNETDRAAWRTKSNEYTREITQAKENHWKEYINNTNETSIWRIKDYVTNKRTSTFIPTLKNNVATIEQKQMELRKTFFPKPPRVNLHDINDAEYPQEVTYEPQITIR